MEKWSGGSPEPGVGLQKGKHAASHNRDPEFDMPAGMRLHRGWVRYPAPLEAEYLRHRTEQFVPLSRAAALIGLLFHLGWLLLSAPINPPTIAPPYRWLLIGVCIPGALLYLLASFEPRLRPQLPRLAVAYVLTSCLSVAVILLDAVSRAAFAPAAALLVSLLFNFCLMGLTFRKALPIGLTVLAVYGIGKLWLHPTAESASQVLFVLTAVTLGSVACRAQEITHRRAWQHARRLHDLLDRDPLTGLLNYRAFFQRAQALLRRALRNDQPLAVLVIDADHFKAINDNHGHLCGDDCLRALGVTLADRGAQPHCIAARLGGEEFALLLFGLSQAEALTAAEQLRQRINQLDVQGRDEQALRLSASIGVACLAADERVADVETLLARADTAMYRAKAAGRNRVSL